MTLRFQICNRFHIVATEDCDWWWMTNGEKGGVWCQAGPKKLGPTSFYACQDGGWCLVSCSGRNKGRLANIIVKLTFCTLRQWWWWIGFFELREDSSTEDDSGKDCYSTDSHQLSTKLELLCCWKDDYVHLKCIYLDRLLWSSYRRRKNRSLDNCEFCSHFTEL